MSDYQVKMLFLTPTLVLLILMNLFPLLWSLYLSFTQYTATGAIAPHWIGIGNFHDLLADPNVWSYFRITAEFVVMAVGVEFFLGFGLALLLNREFPFKGLVTTLLLLPMMLSPVVVGLFWRFILDANFGVLNYFLGAMFHTSPIVWLTQPRLALLSLVIVDAWMWTPFMMLISLAGLSAVPKHLYEAAEVDRASGWFRFRYITLPMVAPLLTIALLFRTMDAFKAFDLVYILTNGGPGTATETVAMNLYRVAFSQFDTGKACAFAYIVLIIIIAMSKLYVRYLTKIKGEL